MKPAQQGHALLTKYVTLWSKKYGRAPSLNRYKEKWAMVDVIDSVGYERAVQLIEYYFRLDRVGHPIQWFFYNFDRMDDMLKEIERDERDRVKLKLETKRRVSEWESQQKKE